MSKLEREPHVSTITSLAPEEGGHWFTQAVNTEGVGLCAVVEAAHGADDHPGGDSLAGQTGGDRVTDSSGTKDIRVRTQSSQIQTKTLRKQE